jgi:2'-5' RNA ligase
MKRVFFGLELPASLRTALAAIDPKMRDVRWTRTAQMHLTLSFLGNVDEDSQQALHDAAESIRVPPFFLPIRGLGTFGGGRPGVLWAGVGNGHPHLFALHKRVQDAILHAGLEPDLRPFHPHVTLARPRGVSASQLRPLLREHEETEFGLAHIEELVLFSSHPTGAGSVYTPELRVRLV